MNQLRKSIIATFLLFLIVSDLPIRAASMAQFTHNQEEVRQMIAERLKDLKSYPKFIAQDFIDSISFESELINFGQGILSGQIRALSRDSTVQNFLESSQDQKAMILVIENGQPSTEKTRINDSSNTPFITFAEGTESLNSLSSLINSSVRKIEAITGHTFKNSITILPLEEELVGRVLLGVFETSTNEFRMNREFLEALNEVAVDDELSAIYDQFEEISKEALNEAQEGEGIKETLFRMSQKIASSLQSQVWECIACVVVLAIAIPLGANFLLAAIADEYCQFANIDPVEYIALLMNLLLPLFALVIFKVCKLQNCASKY